MLCLVGRKRFYFIPSQRVEELRQLLKLDKLGVPVFTSSEAIAIGFKCGLILADVCAGDYVYFPCDYFHEVHNLDSTTRAISNAVFNPMFMV